MPDSTAWNRIVLPSLNCASTTSTVPATRTAFRRKFAGPYAYRVLTGGVGHNLPQEAPAEFAQAVIDVARLGA